ncbi:MAG: hypothetical protein DRH56_09625 [Deltaproteobacteria bacterium]|nr:MAG: hypothetical protein DRH56_09625 [Deltaproteobacteria bacterium]
MCREPQMSALRFVHAGLSDPGRVRKENQDGWTARVRDGLFIVSDGMGGAFRGGLASRIVVETLPALVAERLGNVRDLSGTAAREGLGTAISELSAHLRRETDGEPGLSGMGATVVAAVIRGRRALVGHLGDSRAYLLREGRLARLTEDHSLVRLLLSQGEITPEEAARHPARGRLTRCVGMPGAAMPGIRCPDLRPADRLLLCTDGLTSMVPDDRISALMAPPLSPAGACGRLVSAANLAGGKDNITVLIISILPASA